GGGGGGAHARGGGGGSLGRPPPLPRTVQTVCLGGKPRRGREPDRAPCTDDPRLGARRDPREPRHRRHFGAALGRHRGCRRSHRRPRRRAGVIIRGLARTRGTLGVLPPPIWGEGRGEGVTCAPDGCEPPHPFLDVAKESSPLPDGERAQTAIARPRHDGRMTESKLRTQVGIVGAGPAGLMLSHLLHRAGVESVVLENRSRGYIESRIRAGLIEQWASDLLVETGVGDRMQREGMFHNGVYFAFGGALHYINFRDLVGKGVTIYGQQEVIKDLIEQRLADGGTILFEASDVSVHDFAGRAPKIRFRHEGRDVELACDFIGGCDGFHGICRPSIPATALSPYDREYPFGWVGILSESPPPKHELIYAYHERGFALYTMRSPTLA